MCLDLLSYKFLVKEIRKIKFETIEKEMIQNRPFLFFTYHVERMTIDKLYGSVVVSIEFHTAKETWLLSVATTAKYKYC